MNLIPQITNAPLQKQTFILGDGTSFSLTINYIPLQNGWFITELTYGVTFILRNIRITNNMNILLPWRNLIPFGLACISTANREPTFQDDFLSGASKLYVLNQAETNQFTEFLRLG